MVRARKYSGSSSFLNKFQRNVEREDPVQTESVAPPGPTPEAILESLADRIEAPIASIEKEFEVGAGGLDEPIDQLLKLRLAERKGPALRLTEVGQRAAGFSKIARK